MSTPLSPGSSQHPKVVCAISATTDDLTKRPIGRPRKKDISTRTCFLLINILL